jgi:hypothetical protein
MSSNNLNNNLRGKKDKKDKRKKGQKKLYICKKDVINGTLKIILILNIILCKEKKR